MCGQGIHFAVLANLSTTAFPCLFTWTKLADTKFRAKVLTSSIIWPKELRHGKAELSALGAIWFINSHHSILSFHNSILKNDGTHLNSQKKVCLASHNSISNFLFSSLNSLIFELWVMETENAFWLLSISIIHNSIAFL